MTLQVLRSTQGCHAYCAKKTAKPEALNLRIKPKLGQLIHQAAQLAGKNRQFLARLDAPPKPNKRLLKSMQTRREEKRRPSLSRANIRGQMFPGADAYHQHPDHTSECRLRHGGNDRRNCLAINR